MQLSRGSLSASQAMQKSRPEITRYSARRTVGRSSPQITASGCFREGVLQWLFCPNRSTRVGHAAPCLHVALRTRWLRLAVAGNGSYCRSSELMEINNYHSETCGIWFDQTSKKRKLAAENSGESLVGPDEVELSSITECNVRISKRRKK
jgi:hypothetical protein